MLVPSLGALLVIGGLLFMASQTILHGRLSESRRRARGTDVTLEPRERGGGFGLGIVPNIRVLFCNSLC